MTDTCPPAALTVAVVMRRERLTGAASRWADWRWTLADVVTDAAGLDPQPRLMYDHGDESAWLHPGFSVALHRDDAEGYFLNASTDSPCWWVMWRLVDGPDGEARPEPQVVTLSYHDAGRWLDAQETVEQVPAPPEVVAWLREFVAQHYQPEVKRRQRPASFQTLTDRFGNPARISTDKRRGGGGGG